MQPSKPRGKDRKSKKERRRQKTETVVVAELEPRRIRRLTEIKPLTEAQEAYDGAMRANTIIFGVGPAGTGKTYLAALRAAEALDKKRIEKIVVTRPAVEAGESLGFLPGEMEEKYEPYFRPVRDALEEYFGAGALEYHLKNGSVEARPLAFLRGATIKHSWLLLDEAQNVTSAQMKMLLTRIGKGSKFIINGDPTQCDLAHRQTSGLEDAVTRLSGVNGVAVVSFNHRDIVRHGIIQDIIEAYQPVQRSESYTENYEQASEGLRRILRA